MAQEAKKLAKKLKEGEEASQWSGIPIEKLLNELFTEQLNYMQDLRQIAPLHSAREHLPQDIIRILERLGKVLHKGYTNISSEHGLSFKIP